MAGKSTAAASPSEIDGELYEELLALGEAAVGDNEKSRHDPKAVVQAIRDIARLLAENPALAQKLAEGDVDAAFLAVGVKFADALAPLIEAAPPDLRRFEIISPDDEKAVTEAVSLLAQMRDSATDTARGMRRVEDADILGRGLQFNRNSARDVADAIHQFVSGAQERQKLLRRAGIRPERVTKLSNLQPALNEIARRQGDKRVAKSELSARIHALTVSIAQCYFPIYRARVRMAVNGDPKLMEKALGPVPRLADRRTPTATGSPTPPDKPTPA